MVTIGSQASGDTGLKSWMSGLMAPFTRRRQTAGDAERHGDDRCDDEAERRRSSAR